jgi:hypothetical protein
MREGFANCLTFSSLEDRNTRTMAIVCKSTWILISSSLAAIRSGYLQRNIAERYGYTMIEVFTFCETFKSFMLWLFHNFCLVQLHCVTVGDQPNMPQLHYLALLTWDVQKLLHNLKKRPAVAGNCNLLNSSSLTHSIQLASDVVLKLNYFPIPLLFNPENQPFLLLQSESIHFI